jgi:hypothetical protein
MPDQQAPDIPSAKNGHSANAHLAVFGSPNLRLGIIQSLL